MQMLNRLRGVALVGLTASSALLSFEFRVSGSEFPDSPHSQRETRNPKPETRSWATPPRPPSDPKLIPVTPTPGFYANSPPAWQAIHAKLLALTKRHTGPLDILLIGDSITYGWGGGWDQQPLIESWQEHFGQYKTLNLGVGGDTTQNVLWRLEHGEIDGLRPRLVILAVGVNNVWNAAVPAKSVALGVQQCVTTLRAKLPGANVLVLCVLPTGRKPGDSNRKRAASIITETKKLQLDSDSKVRVLDIGARFLQPNGVLRKDLMPDFLHPSDEGYEVYANAIEPVVADLIK
ncbi:MAG: hypothetical protein HZA90_23190 [Verrucomicrobia bacterium]|nr:hypothetical protein [Verrucomicrobiota bacterium]